MLPEISVLNISVIVGFVFIHYSLDFFSVIRISAHKLMSFSAGIAISYVLIHLLPKLVHGQEVLNDHFNWLSGVQYTYGIYIFVWLGFIVFYTLYLLNEKSLAKDSRLSEETLGNIYFWSDISFFSIYNLMIGYLVISESFSGISKSIVYFCALGLHFLMNNWGLKHHHGKRYVQVGRVILSLSIVVGSMIALLFKVPDFIVVIGEALVTGAMILNSIRFELPIDHQSHSTSFLVGSVSSAVLFLFI